MSIAKGHLSMTSREGSGPALLPSWLWASSGRYCAARATGNADWVQILYFDVMVSTASAAWFWSEARSRTDPIAKTRAETRAKSPNV